MPFSNSVPSGEYAFVIDLDPASVIGVQECDPFNEPDRKFQ